MSIVLETMMILSNNCLSFQVLVHQMQAQIHVPLSFQPLRKFSNFRTKDACFAPVGYQAISIIEKFRTAVPAIITCHPGNGKISKSALPRRPLPHCSLSSLQKHSCLFFFFNY